MVNGGSNTEVFIEARTSSDLFCGVKGQRFSDVAHEMTMARNPLKATHGIIEEVSSEGDAIVPRFVYKAAFDGDFPGGSRLRQDLGGMDQLAVPLQGDNQAFHRFLHLVCENEVGGQRHVRFLSPQLISIAFWNGGGA